GGGGVGGGRGLWKVLRVPRPAPPPHLFFAELQEITALEDDRAVHDAAGRPLDEPHDRQRGHTLATARLAHERHGLTGVDVPTHAVDGADDTGARYEVGGEGANIEERTHRGRESTTLVRPAKGAALNAGWRQ